MLIDDLPLRNDLNTRSNQEWKIGSKCLLWIAEIGSNLKIMCCIEQKSENFGKHIEI